MAIDFLENNLLVNKSLFFQLIDVDLLIMPNQDLTKIFSKYLDQGDDFQSLAEIVTAIKKNYISPHGQRLTNIDTLGKTSLQWGNCQPSFHYKRDQLLINCPEDHFVFFGIKNSYGQKIHPFFLNSGQAAINVTLLHLIQYFNEAQIEFLSWPYTGTKLLLDEYKITNSFFNNLVEEDKILWICSSSVSNNNLEQLFQLSNKFKCVVIDTTCWSLGSDLLAKLLNHFQGINQILIRSHSKLDMAGIEYGSLGSLISISSNDLIFSDMNSSLERLIRLTGGAPSLDDIPPYFFDYQYFNFLEMRNSEMALVLTKIRDNHNWSVPSGVSLYFPDHLRYFFIFFSLDFYPDAEKENYLKSILNKVMILREIPFGFIPSFGFDECVVSTFLTSEFKDKFVFRICPGVGEKRDKKTIDAIDDFFKWITHKR